jgi:hypothetical protein
MTDIDMVKRFTIVVAHPHLHTNCIGRRGGLHDIDMARLLRTPREQVDRIRVDGELQESLSAVRKVAQTSIGQGPIGAADALVDNAIMGLRCDPMLIVSSWQVSQTCILLDDRKDDIRGEND